MIVTYGRLATSWTCMFRVEVTDELVAVGSWADPRAAVEYGRHAWFVNRARFEGLAPLIHGTDFQHELDNVEMTKKRTDR